MRPTLLLCLLLLATPAAAQTVHTIQDSGPPERRLDLVLLAEGYRAQDEAKFDKDAAALVGRLAETEPFARYRAFLNVHTVFSPTAEAGIGHDGESKPSTLFDTYFGEGVELHGDLAKIQQAALAAPDVDKVLVLCNEHKKGGTTRGPTAIFTTAFATTSGSYLDVAVHELGHLIGNLGDEYTEARTFASQLTDPEALAKLYAANPNVTPFAKRSRIPWRAWIDEDTRVPGWLFTSGVSAFQGAAYRKKGMYRPRRSCKMKNNVSKFCEPCREALVKSFHQHAVPSEVALEVKNGEAVVSVTSIIPAGDLGVSLTRDGDRLTVVVEDRTSWVRGDRSDLIHEFELQVPAGLPVRVEGVPGSAGLTAQLAGVAAQ